MFQKHVVLILSSITDLLSDLFLLGLNVNIMCFPVACVPTMVLEKYVLSCKAFDFF